MVNYGISNACTECKRRRKKCDEARPSCGRCIKSRRECPGYSEAGDRYFVNYAASASTQPTLPRVDSGRPSPLKEENSSTPKDWLSTFIQDFCVEASDPALSRGFLNGLPQLITKAGHSSDLAQAARICAIAADANRNHDEKQLLRARNEYATLMTTFHETLSDTRQASTTEALATAVLLGLYEIIAGEDGAHSAHARGVSSLLSLEQTAFDAEDGTQLFRLANPLVLQSPHRQRGIVPVLRAPCQNEHASHLDELLIRFNPIYHAVVKLRNGEDVDIHGLLKASQTLAKDFEKWPESQPPEWAPIPMTVTNGQLVPGVPYSGSADAYFDLYVAAIWNGYRKMYIIILDTVIQCQALIDDSGVISRHKEQEKLNSLVQDILASVHFNLGPLWQDQALVGEAVVNTIPPRSRVARGLLLLHGLFAIAKFNSVPELPRQQALACLSFIGRECGIRQASMIADPSSPNVDFATISEGHVLLLAGMLLQPSS